MDDFNDINLVTTKEETDKKCPQCGGVMDFNPSTGNLKCPYCDYEEAIKVQKSSAMKADELDFYAAEHTANRDWGIETKTVLCKACGAESIYDALQTSAVCPFCGSNQVMDASDEDTIAPGDVVPFNISDKENTVLTIPEKIKMVIHGQKQPGIELPVHTVNLSMMNWCLHPPTMICQYYIQIFIIANLGFKF